MSGPARLSALGVVLLGVSLAACAGIVGADFSDVHGTSGSGISIDGGNVIPGDDSGKPNSTPDSAPPVIVAEGGVCPTGYTNCDGFCFDLTSDKDHCNSCTTTCRSDPHGAGVCANSACTYACDDDYTLCPAGCCSIIVGTDAGKDTGPPAPDPGIVCGNGASGYCSTANFGFCCGAPESSASDACGDSSSDLNCDYYFYCSSAAECLNSICCYDDSTSQSDENAHSSTCQTTCPSNGGVQVQFCNPAKTPSECLTGTCAAGNMFKGDSNELTTTYYYCQ